ncbi:hypothetical protein [Shimwellia blattae]|uniref:Phage tail protein n=1 Tax=Shimwellia blattae (strain ATCC 29907 / DSM 4481 / JCM 1650 / NBRC 105725 / CDC 9005-74) TaxID=630626 RepID=I2B9D7_SHIBC|nr:hypothetical protein [Shimwellia blattae]AFJ47141.1 hypothetical protein EBL_c20500 [Shimwellia blattae DSM 4481 = NBRC 105725]GAB80739.1 hypothetical protein EB105725_08_00240 [Shimwellia blattae DSM 4481 = NBRC 105725]
MIFWLADRWGEPDPSKIAALPADMLFHWRAYFLKQGIFHKPGSQVVAPVESSLAAGRSAIDEQCAAIMRVLM